MVQQGPGGEPGDCLSTLRPYSDAGCVDLPLTSLGAPVNIGEIKVKIYILFFTRGPWVRVENISRLSQRPRSWGRPPGQDRICPLGISGVATRYFPTGARGELA